MNMIASLPASPSRKEFIRRFALVFLLLVAVISGLGYVFLKTDSSIYLNKFQVHEEKEVGIAQSLLERELEYIVSDVRILAKLPSLREYPHGRDRKAGQRIAQHFLNFAQERRFYDQIRFLDAGGKERIRINFRNGRAEAVPDSALQDKSDRYYFKETWALPEGDIYISPLDLNIEHGLIETPWQPMLRVGAPVFDEAGARMGVVVVNYKGDKLLQDFRQSFNGHGMLLNAEGYWLSSPDHQHEWNFMLGAPDSFASRYPEEWNRILKEGHGHFTNGKGMFTFSTVYRPAPPRHPSVASNQFSSDPERPAVFWKIVSLVPAAELSANRPPSRWFWNAYFVSLILSGMLSAYLAWSRVKRLRLHERITESERLRREITDTIGEGLLVLDRTGRISFANPEAERLLGWSVQELVGQPVHDRFSSCRTDDGAADTHICKCLSPLASGEKCSCEETDFQRKDGATITVRAQSSPIFRNGEAVGVVVVFDDISERKRHQLEYQSVLQTTTEGFWRADMRGRILEVNDSYCRMIGYSREELLTMSIPDIEASEAPEDVAAHMRMIVEQGSDLFETRHRCKNGDILDIEISTTYSASNGGYFMVFARDITERKRFEDKQRKSRAELRDLYEMAPCGYHSLDREGRIVRINQTEADWLGYSPDELIGRKITEFHAPSSTAMFAANFAKFMQDGHVDNVEVDLLRKDGKPFTVLLSATAVYDDHGNYIMNRAAMIDITERKRVEIELRDSEEKFRKLFENAPIGIATGKADMQVVSANEAFCRMFGYTLDELQHKTIYDLTHPDHLEETGKLINRAVGGEIQHYFIEKKYVRKDGSIFWGRAIATELAKQGTQTRYFMGMIEDISERKQAEELQRKNDATLRALLDNVPYLIWLKDADSRFIAANGAFLKTTGLASMDEVRGKTDFDLWPRELAAKYRADDIEVMNSREQKLTVERSLDKGELRWVETFKTPIQDSRGKLIGTTGFAHDITDRIDQEERRLVEVREQRDVLVREVHHRIKNNLQGVVGLLRQHAIDHPEMADVVEVTIGRIYSIAIIHGLQAQALSEEVDLCSLVTSIVDASDGGVEYQNNLGCPVLLNRDEAVPIALSLNELLTNACKHRTGKSLAAVRLESSGDETIITISNQFDAGRDVGTGGGQGMNLVKSLLPKKSADLMVVRTGNIYSVELKLSPPVTIVKPKEV